MTGNGGTLQTTLTISGGVFAPGSSPGRMTIVGDLILADGRLQLEALGPGQLDEIEVTGSIVIGPNAVIEVQLAYTPTAPLTFFTAAGGITVDESFPGPTVVGLLGTEAQGLAGSTVAVNVSDTVYPTEVTVPEIVPGIDHDGDGVPDDADACPGSSATANLVIGTCDTGVANVLVADGCKMSDAVRACELSSRNHGQFASCVAHNAKGWRKDKLVLSKQQGAIQACAAKHDGK